MQTLNNSLCCTIPSLPFLSRDASLLIYYFKAQISRLSSLLHQNYFSNIVCRKACLHMSNSSAQFIEMNLFVRIAQEHWSNWPN